MTTTATTATTTTTTTKRNYVSFFRAKDNFSAWNHEKQFFSALQPVRKWLFRNRKTKTPTHPFVTKLPTAAFNEVSVKKNFFFGSILFQGWRKRFISRWVPVQENSTDGSNVVLPSLNRYLKVYYFKYRLHLMLAFCLSPNRAWISHKVATRLVIRSQDHLAAELHLRSQSAQTWAVERPSCRKAGSKEKI